MNHHEHEHDQTIFFSCSISLENLYTIKQQRQRQLTRLI